MTTPIPPSLERFGDELNRAAHRELSAPPGRARTRLRRSRPRLLAGGTLGLAGVGAALVLILGGSAASPAFAITKSSDGSVLVHLNINSSLPQVNAKLAAMGTHEQIGIAMAPGPAAVSGPVTCAPRPGVSGPTVRVLDGPNGTEVITPGQTGDNTGVGTWHLASCSVYPANTSLSTLPGYSGNS
ncbi:MAG TPA: hypothetical protein VIH85_19580 [Solirubrobacteraceae bacterium]